MIRRAMGLALLLTPAALACVIHGCGDEPLPQDICNWLADENNCYARFSNDIGIQCGYEFVPGNDPVASATGFFQSRDDLSICVKNAGGQIVFDAPPELPTFPLTSIAFTVLDFQANTCGNVVMAGDLTYDVTVQPVDKEDAGIAQSPDGMPLADDIIGGTFSATLGEGGIKWDVACPGGTESHNFNLRVLQKCDPPQLANFVPRAILESSPGLAETTVNPPTPGFIRFRIEYPPLDSEAPNAAPRVVEYFNCLIPPPPPPCADMIKNNLETDIDCGGNCLAKCAEGQSCLVNEDCTSGNCGLNGGFRQCLP
jgi:hypothetical protein